MKNLTTVWILTGIVTLSFGTIPEARSQAADLGEPPAAPTDLSGLPRPTGIYSVTGGFTVDANSREQVRSFYNAVYLVSEGVSMATSSDVASCTPGTNSLAYREAVLRRINWFRAMAGLPASVTFDATANARAQQAAVVMSRNGALSHFPDNTWLCYTGDAANAASNSNLAIGNAGADAITAYIWDFGANNTAVGHRRWLLYPQTQIMGTGDVPSTNGFGAANATWVFDGNYGGQRPATRTPFVAWPPAGYLPYQLAYPQWSFALTNANLSGANVTMRSNGVNVAVSVQPYATGIGENSVVWVPMGLNYTSTSTKMPFNGADTTYSVTVTNIQYGSVITGFTYTVTLFDPQVPGNDYAPPTISGPAAPIVGQGNTYSFTSVPGADGYEWRVSQTAPYDFTDGAETGLGNFTVQTTAGYAVRDSSVKAAGAYSFHLAHPPGAKDQLLTLNQAFVPQADATLTVKSRLGVATSDQVATIQISADGGLSWEDIYTQPGTGQPGETSFVTRSFGLGAFADQEVRLRFNYAFSIGSYYTDTSAGVGWYLDDITISGAEVRTVLSTNLMVAGTNFTFTPPQPGDFLLDVRAYLFQEFPLAWGPTYPVAATTAPPLTITMQTPVLVGNQVRLDFATSRAASFQLLQADTPTGPWGVNTTAALTTNAPGSSYRFSTPVEASARFYRVVSP